MSKPKKSRKQEIRERRARQERQRRLTLIAVIVGIALIVAAFLVVPSLLRSREEARQASLPVGDITEITAREFPNPDGRNMGDPNAPVVIEIWEDFQCPACVQYSSTVEPALIANEIASGTVYYTFRHYPFLDDRVPTSESDQAANASMCAAEQNRFWDYHDILFANWNGENGGAFRDARLIAFADSIGLDMEEFEACFEENRYQNQIEADLRAGNAVGVTGTPSVYVNGTQVTPGFVPTYEQVQEAIREAQPGG